MIDPITTLAFSLYSNKGTYALLLGSGVSRSAGIPTGWEITLDLIKKIAQARGESCDLDPVAWYRKEYGEEPEYSKLLNELKMTPTQRQILLEGYFEPTEDDRVQNRKMPTEAHRSIAELVAKGYVRHIVTTNFDRLIEVALHDSGITPNVLSTKDQIMGALPLAHLKNTVVKVNGDYLDTRIKNTPSELKTYDRSLEQLLDQIFDDFGIIICGWSGEWDTALRDALFRCKSRRFTTYWTLRGTVSAEAKKLIEHRSAETIQIRDADSFFKELKERVLSLEQLSASHPLSRKIAETTLKKYIHEKNEIAAYDLINNETNSVCERLTEEQFPLKYTEFTPDTIRERLMKYDALVETLIALMVTGCYWGKDIGKRLWINCLERLATVHSYPELSIDGWVALRQYPALIARYAAGISSIAAGRFDTLAALLLEARCYMNREPQPRPLTMVLFNNIVLDREMAQRMMKAPYGYTPLSDYMFRTLREPLRDFLPQDNVYEEFFDRYEYIFGLVLNFLRQKEGMWAFPLAGRFIQRKVSGKYDVEKVIGEEVRLYKSDHPLLKAGLFDGDVDQFRATADKYAHAILSAVGQGHLGP